MMQSWTNMIKPLSPIAPSPEEQLRPQQQQQQTFVFTNNRTPPNFSNSSKHRSILPAPSTPSQQQPYIIRPLGGGQQQSKLPLPRVAPVAQSIYPAHETKKTPVPIRSKKTSKVVPNIRPAPQGQNGLMQDMPVQYLAPLNDNEHMIQAHENQPDPADTGQSSIQPQPPPILPASQPLKGKPKVKTGDMVKPGSITDALRKIDERIVEPPTVVAQRMIEQNRTLRRQAELHDIEEHSIMKSHHDQLHTVSMNTQMVSPGMINVIAQVRPEPEPTILSDVNIGAENTEPKLNSEEPASAQEKADVEEKEVTGPEAEAKPSGHPAVLAPGPQVVYQAHPITASNMSNGYQLLIQVPGNMGAQPQLIQSQQILQGQQFGNRPVFIQKQPSPVIQMAQAGAATGKTIYLMTQPSPIQPVGAPQGQYTTSPSFNNYAYLAPQDGIIRLNRPSNESGDIKSEVAEERNIPQGLQQTPAPTSLQQISYEEAAKNQYNVKMQQYQQQFQQRAQMDPQSQLAMQQYYQMNNAAKPKPKAKTRAPPKAKAKPKTKETAEELQQQRMFLPQQQQLHQQQRQFAFQQQYNQHRMMGQVPQYQYSNRIDPSQQQHPFQQQHPQHPSHQPHTIQQHPFQHQHPSQQNPTQQLPPQQIPPQQIPSQQHPQQINQQRAQQMPSENSPQMPNLSQQMPQQQRMPQQMVQQQRPQMMSPGQQQPNRAQLMQQMQATIKANSARNVQRKMSEEDARSPHPASPHPASPYPASPHPVSSHPGTPHSGTPQIYPGTPQPFPGTPQPFPGTSQSHLGTPQAHPGIPAQYNNQGMYSTFSYGPQSVQQLKQQKAKAEEVKPPQFSVQQAKQKLQGSDQPSAQFGRFDASPFTVVSPPEKPKKKPTPKKKDEKKAPAKKRAPKRKADQATPDPRSLHIHAPITFPLEKRTKKVAQRKPSSEKSPPCPYDQQVQSPVYNTPQQTTNMYPNMPTLHQYGQGIKPQQQQFMQQQQMQHYQQWGGDYQQQNIYTSQQQQQQSPYNTGPLYQQQFAQQFQQERSYSPPCTEDIDVNQFLNIPIKNKGGEQS